MVTVVGPLLLLLWLDCPPVLAELEAADEGAEPSLDEAALDTPPPTTPPAASVEAPEEAAPEVTVELAMVGRTK